jgi:hypothetical protein
VVRIRGDQAYLLGQVELERVFSRTLIDQGCAYLMGVTYSYGGSYATAVNDQLMIINLADPANPVTWEYSLPAGGTLALVGAKKGKIFAASFGYTSSGYVYTTTASGYPLGSWIMIGPGSAGYVYTTTASGYPATGYTGYVACYDLTDPAHPKLDEYRDQSNYTSQIAFFGNRAYVPLGYQGVWSKNL